MLARLVPDRGRRLVYTSTDLVFDGSRAWSRERTRAEPVLAYGRTKRDAEPSVLAVPQGWWHESACSMAHHAAAAWVSSTAQSLHCERARRRRSSRTNTARLSTTRLPRACWCGWSSQLPRACCTSPGGSE